MSSTIFLSSGDEVGGGGTALVGGDGERLVVHGVADLDERQPGLDRAVDRRCSSVSQPSKSKRPAFHWSAQSASVGRVVGLDAGRRLAEVLRPRAVVELAVEPLVVGRALAGADRLAGEPVEGGDARTAVLAAIWAGV